MPWYRYMKDQEGVPLVVMREGLSVLVLAKDGCAKCAGRGFNGYEKGCQACLGTGTVRQDKATCAICEGSGKGKTPEEGYPRFCNCLKTELELGEKDRVLE